MSYLVSLGLLVLVASWVAAVYNRLSHLRGLVAEAWLQWLLATRQRNACAADFAAAFTLRRPPGDMLPRSIRKLTEDSELSLESATAERNNAGALRAALAEHELAAVFRATFLAVQETDTMVADEQLQLLGSRLSRALFRQEQSARVFNRMAQDYNHALEDVSGRVLGSVFGFSQAGNITIRG
ncbi:MAG: hypothetical protein Q4F30_07170 [Akkermansia sp.]|nr:hypothetical protein [Akkermansia sp.]